MKIKKINILIISLLFPSLLFAQQIKTYQGAYSGIWSSGKATYSYYENTDYERIYSGLFNYKGEHANKVAYTINGQYKNNKKEGQWTSIVNIPLGYMTFGGGYSIKYSNLKSSGSGNYKDGIKVGIWKFDRTVNVTFQGNSSSYIESYNVNFENDKLIGNFNYKSTDLKNNPISVVIGQFDKAGYLNGEWKIKFTKNKREFEDIRRYQHGVLYWRLLRNMSTGEVIEKLDETDFVNDFFKYHYNESTNVSSPENLLEIAKDKYSINDEYKSTIEDDRLEGLISFWNRTSDGGGTEIIYSGNYLFEVEYGSKDKAIFPERIINKDLYEKEKKDRIEKIRKEEERKRIEAEKRKLEEERKKREHEKLMLFLKERNTTVYDCKEKNKQKFVSLKTKVNENLISVVDKSIYKELNIAGNLIFYADTNKVKKVDASNLTSNNTKILTEILEQINNIDFTPLTINNYLVNSKAIIPIKLNSKKRIAVFKLSKLNKLSYKSDEPDNNIKQVIREQYDINNADCQKGKYEVEYSVLVFNGIEIIKIKTISIK